MDQTPKTPAQINTVADAMEVCARHRLDIAPAGPQGDVLFPVARVLARLETALSAERSAREQAERERDALAAANLETLQAMSEQMSEDEQKRDALATAARGWLARITEALLDDSAEHYNVLRDLRDEMAAALPAAPATTAQPSQDPRPVTDEAPAPCEPVLLWVRGQTHAREGTRLARERWGLAGSLRTYWPEDVLGWMPLPAIPATPAAQPKREE